MDKIATIRGYQPKDYENLREVCFVTATGAYKNNKDITAALFCEYYCECEAEHCFVIADKDDNAVGYILCATDNKEYLKKYYKFKMPKIKKLSYKEAIMKYIEDFYMKGIAKNYPAHLHIDIIDDYQRMGLGHKLINALMLHLDSIGVKAIHLGCGAANTKGVSFYKKIGFVELKRIVGTVIFGLDIHKYVEGLKDKEKNV